MNRVKYNQKSGLSIIELIIASAGLIFVFFALGGQVKNYHTTLAAVSRQVEMENVRKSVRQRISCVETIRHSATNCGTDLRPRTIDVYGTNGQVLIKRHPDQEATKIGDHYALKADCRLVGQNTYELDIQWTKVKSDATVVTMDTMLTNQTTNQPYDWLPLFDIPSVCTKKEWIDIARKPQLSVHIVMAEDTSSSMASNCQDHFGANRFRSQLAASGIDASMTRCANSTSGSNAIRSATNMVTASLRGLTSYWDVQRGRSLSLPTECRGVRSAITDLGDNATLAIVLVTDRTPYHLRERGGTSRRAGCGRIIIDDSRLQDCGTYAIGQGDTNKYWGTWLFNDIYPLTTPQGVLDAKTALLSLHPNLDDVQFYLVGRGQGVERFARAVHYSPASSLHCGRGTDYNLIISDLGNNVATQNLIKRYPITDVLPDYQGEEVELRLNNALVLLNGFDYFIDSNNNLVLINPLLDLKAGDRINVKYR